MASTDINSTDEVPLQTTATSFSTPRLTTKPFRITTTTKIPSSPITLTPLTSRTTVSTQPPNGGDDIDAGAVVGGVLISIVIIIIAILAFIFRNRLLLFYRVCVSRYRKRRHAAPNPPVNAVPTDRSSRSPIYINIESSHPVNERPISVSDTSGFYAEVHTGEEENSGKRDQNLNETEKYASRDHTTGVPVYINSRFGAQLAQSPPTAASGQVNQALTPQSRQQPVYSYTQPPITDPIYGNLSLQSQRNASHDVYEKLQTNANTGSNYSALTFKNTAD